MGFRLSFKGHKRRITCLEVSQSGTSCVSMSVDSEVRVWHEDRCCRIVQLGPKKAIGAGCWHCLAEACCCGWGVCALGEYFWHRLPRTVQRFLASQRMLARRQAGATRGLLFSHYYSDMTRIKLIDGAGDAESGEVGRIVLCVGSSLWLIPHHR
eukprot:Tamp_34070.p1 GENE.Tamp_34070~~Tamp_34070.p1  ORF type:complete len:154 (+),score=10.55 Tamp_34070:1-462(+)